MLGMAVIAAIRSSVINFNKGLQYLQAFKVFFIECLIYTKQIKWENKNVKCFCCLFYSEHLESSQHSTYTCSKCFNLVKTSSTVNTWMPLNVSYRKDSALRCSVVHYHSCTLSSEQHYFLSLHPHFVQKQNESEIVTEHNIAPVTGELMRASSNPIQIQNNQFNSMVMYPILVFLQWSHLSPVFLFVKIKYNTITPFPSSKPNYCMRGKLFPN